MEPTLMSKIERSSRRGSSWLRDFRVKQATFWAPIKYLMMSWISKGRLCKTTWLGSCIKLVKPKSILTNVKHSRRVLCKWVVKEELRATTKILFSLQRHQLEHQWHHHQLESLVRCLLITQRSTCLILVLHVAETDQAKASQVQNKQKGLKSETAYKFESQKILA